MTTKPEFPISIIEPRLTAGSNRRVAPFGPSLFLRLSLPAEDESISFDRVSCTLQGTCSVWNTLHESVPSYNSFTRSANYSFLSINCVREVAQPAAPTLLCEDIVFRLSQNSSFPLCDFPPSMRTNFSCCCSKKKSLNSHTCGGHVQYTLTVGLWARHRNVAKHVEEITLTPCNSPSPPICIQDFPEDYSIKKTKLSKSLFTKASSMLEISVMEPAPIQYTATADVLHTTLNFNVTQTAESHSVLFDRCEPTKSDVKQSSCLSDIVEKYDIQVKTLNLVEWKSSDCYNTLEGHSSSGPDGIVIPRARYATAFSMDFWQKRCRHLVPTFSSSMFLRRYSLVAAISLSGATTQNTVTNDSIEDLSSDIEELPAYDIRGLKLLPDESQQSRYGPSVRSKEILAMLEKDPVCVASDYLRELLDATLRAAENSFGDHQLVMISEPEAAALHTLRAIQPNTITNGDTFVVCDAGGGTVDLISYQVKSVEPLDLYEVVQGDGGICGAAILDKRFETFIKHRLGAHGTGDNEDDLTEFLIVIPGVSDNAEKRIERGMMIVESEDIATIFDPIIEDIESLVHTQIKNAKLAGYNVKAILLVGGFGSSTYLYRRLQKKFNGIDIMQPPNAWTSVVRGAVLRGTYGNAVTSRKARRHYGVMAYQPFDPERHPVTCRVWDTMQEKWRAENRMAWFVSKGMELLDGKKISLKFYRVVDTDFGNFVFRDKLLCCDDEFSPKDGKNPCRINFPRINLGIRFPGSGNKA
ncbi:hypothetical protein V496_02081 [Pseudogymnoascus sp. VKM F-4515 (FW-2607)]|nr:hypothetical protein V496_02081 [Pseudogymnoascus sp. VKM F-4515 (FW-2607)]